MNYGEWAVLGSLENGLCICLHCLHCALFAFAFAFALFPFRQCKCFKQLGLLAKTWEIRICTGGSEGQTFGSQARKYTQKVVFLASDPVGPKQ
jgi:hypothetical protein